MGERGQPMNVAPLAAALRELELTRVERDEAVGLLRRWWNRFPAASSWDAIQMSLDTETNAFLSRLDAGRVRFETGCRCFNGYQESCGCYGGAPTCCCIACERNREQARLDAGKVTR